MAAAKTDRRARVVRVALAGGGGYLRRGLQELLARDERLRLARGESGLTARDGHAPDEALARDTGAEADVIVASVFDADPGACALIADLRARFPDAVIVALVIGDDPLLTERVLQAGAHGVVPVEHADTQLASAIVVVAAGERYLSAPAARRLLALHDSLRDDKLSVREMEVLWLIARGFTSPEIARQLGLSTRTIEAHRARVARKLGASTRAELVRHALDRRLLSV
jgi:DNA-binding NarL/FixJ family response regulator